MRTGSWSTSGRPGEIATERAVELLAPAGGPPALQAALSAGADAVYLGLDRWSARAFAGNFGPDDLLAAIDRAHLYGARLHLALNVLLKDDELEPALAALAEPYAAGLDALIVADLGFAALVREAYPGLELHASTQLDTHSSAQLETLAGLGFARAILARELSIEEIAALRPHGLALEAFVHGALCYGYSGACLLSSMASGRSGNRGRCSQACRMRYRLGEQGHGGEVGRLLSTADLAAVSALPALLAAGVTSFKIEGRMKDAAYVAVTTAVYREALDAALADPVGFAVRPDWLARLEQSFSRGFTTAHLDGRHAEVRAGGRGGHRGVRVGRVVAVDEHTGDVAVRLERGVELHPGDVVRLYTVWGATEPARLEVLLAPGERGEGDVDDARQVVLRVRERVSVKDRLFRLSSGESDAFAADAASGRALARPVTLAARLRGSAGERPRLTVWADGEEVFVEGDRPLQLAETAALTADKARRALASLGGTPYRLAEFEYAVGEGMFLGVGPLKELRRRAVAALDERRLARGQRRGAAPAPGRPRRRRTAARRTPTAPAERPFVVVRARPHEIPLAGPQVDAVCLDLRTSDDTAAIAAAARRAREAGVELRVRSPEVLFDGDAAWTAAVAALGWPLVYARHPAAIGWAPAVVLEYPLQGLNGRTAPLLGAAGVVCSPELTLEEVAALAATLPDAVGLEALAFGCEQVLVTRDTLGRAEGLVPDEQRLREAVHETTVTDARGYAFPVDVAVGETRIFNARVTNLCGRWPELRGAGVGTLIVVQRDLSDAEREAFVRDGVKGLASFADRDRFTTGHLHRGVD